MHSHKTALISLMLLKPLFSLTRWIFTAVVQKHKLPLFSHAILASFWPLFLQLLTVELFMLHQTLLRYFQFLLKSFPVTHGMFSNFFVSLTYACLPYRPQKNATLHLIGSKKISAVSSPVGYTLVSDLLLLSPCGHLEQMCTNARFSPSVDGASSYGTARMSLPPATTSLRHMLFRATRIQSS